MHFSFDWTIRLYDVIVFGAAVITALWAWRDLSWRVRNIETWKEQHLHSYTQAVTNITMLREAVVKLEQIAAGQDRRLIMLEDREEIRKRGLQ